ncbi:hypothetical protein [Salmonella enterica]|uniref:hypothetical protein n=1 Tax=Salmonella enterica TaxID=28901 RepID=UPI00117ADE03|nr:hypothetical protein [Salmonella enterica]TRN88331.1 hypothetical protein DX372_24725 [Salmonella enterica subsp. enterica]
MAAATGNGFRGLRKKELVALDSGKRTTVGSGGFFVYRKGDYDWNESLIPANEPPLVAVVFLFTGKEITTGTKGSQEDPAIFIS